MSGTQMEPFVTGTDHTVIFGVDSFGRKTQSYIYHHHQCDQEDDVIRPHRFGSRLIG